jgi:hypothetical protein
MYAWAASAPRAELALEEVDRRRVGVHEVLEGDGLRPHAVVDLVDDAERARAESALEDEPPRGIGLGRGGGARTGFGRDRVGH